MNAFMKFMNAVYLIQLIEGIHSNYLDIRETHYLIEKGHKCIDIINNVLKQAELDSNLKINTLAKLHASILDNYYHKNKRIYGKLHCNPVIVDFRIDVKSISGAFITHGDIWSGELIDSIPNEDSQAISNLKKEGAIIIAKSINAKDDVNEYKNYNDISISCNSTIATGNIVVDTDGAVLNTCKLYGLRLSLDDTLNDRIIPIFEKQDSISPLATNIHDLAVFYSIMANQPYVLTRFLKFDSSNWRLKIAYIKNFFNSSLVNKQESKILNDRLQYLANEMKSKHSITIYDYEIDDKNWNLMKILLENLKESKVKCQTSCFKSSLNNYFRNSYNNSEAKKINFNKLLNNNKLSTKWKKIFQQSNLIDNHLKSCQQSCPLYEYYRAKFINNTSSFFVQSKADVLFYPTLLTSTNEYYDNTAFLSVYSGLPAIRIPIDISEKFSIGLTLMSMQDNMVQLFRVAELFV